MTDLSPASRSADLHRKLAAQRSFAKQMAINFAVKHRLIEFEKFDTGSSLPDENIRITHCFGKHFEKWDEPQTTTVDSAKTYIWNVSND